MKQTIWRTNIDKRSLRQLNNKSNCFRPLNLNTKLWWTSMFSSISMAGSLTKKKTGLLCSIKCTKKKSRWLSGFKASLIFRSKIFFPYFVKWTYLETMFLFAMIQGNWKWFLEMKKSDLARSTCLFLQIEKLIFMLLGTTGINITALFSFILKPLTQISCTKTNTITIFQRNQIMFDCSINFSLLNIYR